MVKKILVFICIAISFFSFSYAGNFYLSPNLILFDTTSPNGSFRGVKPRLSFGYAEMLSIYTYLAGEIFAEPLTMTLSSNTQDLTNLKTTRNFGISVLPGFMINQDALGYFRLGLISTKFDGPNTTQTGAQVGLGVLLPLDRTWSVRGEYTYSAYSSTSQIGAPKTDQFMLGLVYLFNE